MSREKIQDEYRDKMNALAETVDEFFNGTAKGEQRKTCFVLLVAEFGDHEGRVNYISNGDRHDVTMMMKEVTARFEGQPEIKGRT